MKRGGHTVYFLEAGNADAIKIGLVWTRPDLPFYHYFERRFTAIQACCPLSLVLLGTTMKFSERALHDKFWSLRLHGEWFRADAELRQFIKIHADPPPMLPIKEKRKMHRDINRTTTLLDGLKEEHQRALAMQKQPIPETTRHYWQGKASAFEAVIFNFTQLGLIQ